MHKEVVERPIGKYVFAHDNKDGGWFAIDFTSSKFKFYCKLRKDTNVKEMKNFFFEKSDNPFVF